MHILKKRFIPKQPSSAFLSHAPPLAVSERELRRVSARAARMFAEDALGNTEQCTLRLSEIRQSG